LEETLKELIWSVVFINFFVCLLFLMHLQLMADLVIMAALRSRCGHYIFALWFLSFFFFSLLNLSSRRVGVYHTFRRGVALMRI